MLQQWNPRRCRASTREELLIKETVVTPLVKNGISNDSMIPSVKKRTANTLSGCVKTSVFDRDGVCTNESRYGSLQGIQNTQE